MYIARDSDGTLTAFARKPQRTFFYEGESESNVGWWYSDYDEGIQLDKEEDYYPELKWEDEPIKVLPMAVTDDNQLKNYWMATPALHHGVLRIFVDPVSAENFAKNNFKDEGLKVWHFTHE